MVVDRIEAGSSTTFDSTSDIAVVNRPRRQNRVSINSAPSETDSGSRNLDVGSILDSFARQARRALNGDNGALDRFSIALFGADADSLDEAQLTGLLDFLFGIADGRVALSVTFVSPSSLLDGLVSAYVPAQGSKPGTLLVSRSLKGDTEALNDVLREGFGEAAASYGADVIGLDLSPGDQGGRLARAVSGETLDTDSSLFDADAGGEITVRFGGRQVPAVAVSGSGGAGTAKEELLAVRKDMASEAATDSGWRAIVMALTGKRLRDLPPTQQDALVQLRDQIVSRKVVPSVETVPQGAFVPGDGRTILPVGVDGAFVPGVGGEPGRILLAEGLTPEQRSQTLAEEFGEAVAEAAKGLGIQPADGDAGERLRRVVAGDDVRPDAPATRSLFVDAPDDTAEVQVDGQPMMVETKGMQIGTEYIDAYLKHMFAADGFFSDSEPNGVLSAGELEVAFSHAITSTDPSAKIQPFTGYGSHKLSAAEKADLQAMVNYHGFSNTATGFMAVNSEILRVLIENGNINFKMSGLDRLLVVDVVSPNQPASEPDPIPSLTLQEAYQVAKTLPPAEIKSIVSSYGAVGLMSYISRLLGLVIPTETIQELAAAFASAEGNIATVSPHASTIVRVSAMAFSAIMLGNKGYGEGLEIFRTAVRSDLGLEQSDHGVGRWAEYVFMGSRDKANETDKGATAQTEFARSFLSVGRTVVAETEGEAAAAALDSATPTDNAAIPGSEKLEITHRPVEAWPRERDDNDPEDPYIMNDDGTFAKPNSDYFRYADVTSLGRDYYKRVDNGPMVELVGVTDEEVQRLGLKAVLVVTDRDSVAADDLKEVDWTDQETIQNLVNNGFRVSYVRAYPQPMAVQTSRAVSDPLRAMAEAPRQYAADGTLVAGPAARIAQYYHNTQFEAVRYAPDDDENIAAAEWEIDLVSHDKGYSDRDAIRFMLNDLGLSDADIETLVAEAQRAVGGMSSIVGPNLSANPTIDFFQDFLTGGFSTLFKHVFPGDGHPWTDFARKKLVEAGRSTAQADQMAEPFEGSKMTEAVLVEFLGFMLFDLVGLDILGDVAGAAKAARASRSSLADTTSDIVAARSASNTTDSLDVRNLDADSKPRDNPDGVQDGRASDGPDTKNTEIESVDTQSSVDEAVVESAWIKETLTTRFKDGPYEGMAPEYVLQKAGEANWLVNIKPELTFREALDGGYVIRVDQASAVHQAKFIDELKTKNVTVENLYIPENDMFGRPGLRGGGVPPGSRTPWRSNGRSPYRNIPPKPKPVRMLPSGRNGGNDHRYPINRRDIRTVNDAPQDPPPNLPPSELATLDNSYEARWTYTVGDNLEYDILFKGDRNKSDFSFDTKGLSLDAIAYKRDRMDEFRFATGGEQFNPTIEFFIQEQYGYVRVHGKTLLLYDKESYGLGAKFSASAGAHKLESGFEFNERLSENVSLSVRVKSTNAQGESWGKQNFTKYDKTTERFHWVMAGGENSTGFIPSDILPDGILPEGLLPDGVLPEGMGLDISVGKPYTSYERPSDTL